MSNFWDGIDGKKESAFSGGFELLPEGTQVQAQVTHVLLQKERVFTNQSTGAEETAAPHFEVKWTVLDGPYKSRVLFQKLRVFEEDEKKAKRAKNMLMYLFNIFNLKPPAAFPSESDVMSFSNKIGYLLVGVWEMNGKSGNMIREVYANKSELSGSVHKSSPNLENTGVKTKFENDINF